MRALVTGAGGFAGTHLVTHLRAQGDEVVEVSRARGTDLLDAGATKRAVAAADPEVVYHLAADAHVGQSWQDPAGFLQRNVTMTLHLLDAVRGGPCEATVVCVSSGEVYGPPVQLPVVEDAPLRPQNPYAVSKASADLLAGFYADANGMDVIRARPFNHSGPGQEPIYAIAAFARQVAAGAAGEERPVVVRTGNPDTRRDYTDVRDVVRAYRLIAAHGERGEAYNVCSGVTASASELVAGLARAAGVVVDHQVDPGLRRAHEVMEVRGDAGRLHAATGWSPALSLQETLQDTLKWWVASERGPVPTDS